MSSDPQLRNHAPFIWSVADKLRGVYKQSEYGRVILPLVVLRRLDCVLEPTKPAVLARYEALKGRVENVAPVLESIAGQQFYNISPLDFRRLLDDPANVTGNLQSYIAGFSPAARDVIEKFGFDAQITRLERANLLYLVVSQFAEIDLHPNVVSNVEMGYLYEELVRKFSELSNETAGEHFTPREVIRLMVDLLFVEDDGVLQKPGIVKTLFDPACGTGGMLSVAEDYLRELNPEARLEVFGQELNEETYAVCRSDMMLKGQDASHIVQGNSFDDDGHRGRTFDYMLANPPFGVEWKSVQQFVVDEREKLGFSGRFGAGLPPINDGSFLFLQHMISKMKPAEEGGSRLAIVFNGSPLFTGAAGSGPSEIRRWIIENDWLEAVVALPDQLFYNTGISTYFWVVTNRKSAEMRGKVQLVDARELWVKMRKSLGEKRKAISPEQIEEITRLYGAFEESERVKILRNEQFGYQRITVERPLRRRFEVTEPGLDAFFSDGMADRIDEEWHGTIRAAWSGLTGATTDPDEFLRRLSAALPSDLRPTPFMDIVRTGRGKNGKAYPLAAVAWFVNAERDIAAISKAVLKAFAVRDPDGEVVLQKNGEPEPDPELRDQENAPLPDLEVSFEADPSARLATEPYRGAANDYLQAEVMPFIPDAWLDDQKTKIGYEIPLIRHFYKYDPPRALERIDSDLRELEATIAELLEKAEAARAVLTVGLDSSPVFRSTGVSWLPQVPSHWRTSKLPYLGQIRSGATPSTNRDDYWNGDMAWVSPKDMKQFEISSTQEYVTAAALQETRLPLIAPGSVLFVVRGMILAHSFPVAVNLETVTINQDMKALTPENDDPRYVAHVLAGLSSPILSLLIEESAHGTRALRMERWREFPLFLPPLEEQHKIVSYVEEEIARINSLLALVAEQAALLSERRSAFRTSLVEGRQGARGVLV